MWRIYIFILVAINVFANGALYNEYNILYNDLTNFDSPGYKSSWDDISHKGSNGINFSQGAFTTGQAYINFAISGRGFLKIRLEDGIIGYTRSGEFNISFDESESVYSLRTAREGYELYDNIIIPINFVELKLEYNNILFALLGDNSKIAIGIIDVYEIDPEILIRYKNSIFIATDNFNSPNLIDSRIYTGYLEQSNVNIIETLIRMYDILFELRNFGNSFENKEQIILMLINNIPIIDGMTTLRIELKNILEKFSEGGETIIQRVLTITSFGQEFVMPLADMERMNRSMQRIHIENNRYDLLRRSLYFLRME
jgi:flagellar basal body rod protein FlgG